MKSGKRTISALISLFLSMIMVMTMAAAAFAEDTDETGSGYRKLAFSDSIDQDDIKGADPDELLEKYFLSDDSDTNGLTAPEAPLSAKGSRLGGKNLKFYNYYKSIIKKVSAGKTTATTKKVSLKKILGKRTFTARQLGVKKIGYKKNGRWYVTSAAQKKIQELLGPENWKKVYQGLLSDMTSESYWVDWYTDNSFIRYNCAYRYTSDTLTFEKNDWIEFCLPVMPEFAKAKNSAYNYIYKVDKNKINSASKARSNARRIVQTFDNEIPTTFAGYSPEAIDYLRLWYYCRVIADLNTYDSYSAQLEPEDRYWHGPWSMIYVFDDDTGTNAVCAGYARAFKYLCDLTDFESDWIDCQIATGSAGGVNSSHMWNIVRMNDGLNYLVDPTWIDDDTNSAADERWFMRGDPYGSSTSFTVEGIYREYDDWTKSVFAAAERKLAAKDSYEFSSDRPILLKGTKISGVYSRNKGFKIKWNKMKTPLGALYVDGYQIQYSTNKSFSNAKSVKVKGYNKSSKVIRNLKKNKRYYVRIRTYAKLGKHTYYSSWSGRKRIKTK